MKRLLPILSFALFLTACNQSAKIDPGQAAVTAVQAAPVQADTAGLAAFQDWKIKNELADDETYNTAQKAVASAPVRRSVAKATPVRRVSTQAPVRRTSTAKSTSGSSSEGVNDGGGTMSNETTQAAKKEGMSKAAKGAIIGGVGGAVAGAVINKKNRTAGAVVGAVIGAGGGYVIGRQQDKKDGRIDFQMK